MNLEHAHTCTYTHVCTHMHKCSSVQWLRYLGNKGGTAHSLLYSGPTAFKLFLQIFVHFICTTINHLCPLLIKAQKRLLLLNYLPAFKSVVQNIVILLRKKLLKNESTKSAEPSRHLHHTTIHSDNYLCRFLISIIICINEHLLH